MNATENILRILSIEDSEDDLELIKHALSSSGITAIYERVETAESLKAALECKTWDMVICDHNMPALDSISALGIVRKVNMNVPFIIVSGSIQENMAIEAMGCGAKDFINKGNLAKLAMVVRRELEEAELRSNLKAMQERLHHVSHFDSLTGLPNRECFFKYLESIIPGMGDDHVFAIFLIDLDRFRQITQSFGMSAGNKILIDMSARLSMALGDKNFIARIDGDTFVAVIPYLEPGMQAREMVTAIHQCMDEAFEINCHKLFLKTSVGASFFPRDGREWDVLFKNAEFALYNAKETAGNSYKEYKPEMDSPGRAHLVMESALYYALAQQEFVLHYQPQIDLASGKIIGAEALIRWNHPESGLILPGKFIPILEETGLIIPVGEWVLRAACIQNRKWQDAGMPPIRIAVNLSVLQFRQPGLADTISEILEETGLSPEYLEVEITENIAMHAEDTAIRTLDELHATGIKIAIDDFGTGYSSLSYLKNFPIEKLKIDQSFVRNYKGGVSDDVIVKAIINMGRSLNLKVIAEGVETQEQSDFLMLHGCDEAQGYFYGKPMEGAAFANLMGLAVSGDCLCG